ncbi:MAG: HAMP domain-containing sensor histidine kinase [Panacibacter sp.]
MPVRIRITLFFALIVFAILSLVCTSIYYFSSANRRNNFNGRLANRAVTTARFLAQSETFNQDLIQKIDASTAVAMTNKTTQAYDFSGKRIYANSDKPGDTIAVEKKILEGAKTKEYVYFFINNKNAVAYHYANSEDQFIIIAAAYDAEGINNLQQLQFILWICFIGGILVAVAGGYFFSASLLRPILKIADELRDISVENLTRRIEAPQRKDEWSYLTNILNELLDRLEESFETQQRFIANASHELLTPLTSLSSQLEVSLLKERDVREYQRVMKSILQDVQHLSKLTQTLLEFAKASGTAGGLEINLVRIDEIILRMPREMSKINKDYVIRITFDDLPDDDEKLLILGNEDLLFSALKNIVLNACKYSENQQATVALTVNEFETLITISDEGKGIPSHALQKIFQPFYRFDDNNAENGFGLGLPLTSHIIKLHKGKIEVNSKIDEGTNFIIHLPLASMQSVK